jgi:plastocyanin
MVRHISAGGDTNVYHYNPPTLTVPAGVPVEVVFSDDDVLDHTWTVFDADGTTVLANLSVAKEGDQASGVFVFPRPGTYVFACTIPGHRRFGEQGTLVVTP